MISTAFVLGALLLGSANAANDWKVPCVSGSCSYDLPGTTSASGTMKIWGSSDAITDITTAAGWQIVGCNSTAMAQDIRLVCTSGSDSDPDSLCSHLYQSSGAVNKLVRLPENCGASPFARIAKSWVPEDQSLPKNVRRMLPRSGPQPVVKALRLDTNFDRVDPKFGAVNIAIQGANVPGAPTTMVVPTGSHRRSRDRRGFGDFIKGAIDSVSDGVKSAVGAVTGAAQSTADAAKEAAAKAEEVAKEAAAKTAEAAKAAADKAKEVANDVKDAAKDAVEDAGKVVGAVKDNTEAAATDANTIDINKGIDLPPLNFNKKINLVDQSVDCGPAQAKLRVDVDAKANAQVTLNVAAIGTIVPPKISSFGAVASMNADVTGTITLNADVLGTIGTGQVTLFEAGIPGLDFPGILTIGPSFKVAGSVDGTLDVALDADVGINFNVKDAKIAFPPKDDNAPDGKAFSIGDTPLTLSTTPDVTAKGKITAHLIPSINLGIDALGGKADAQVTLAVDANAALTLGLSGSAAATVVQDVPIDGGDADRTVDVTKPTFGGCVKADSNINVNVGANADFFGLFSGLNTKKVLFNKDFALFKKCFGDEAQAAKSVKRNSSERRFVRRAALACPIPGLKKSEVTSGTISASSIA
ncbi:hypothetical protein R3P38DRAFT_3146303 [Favolaschia claudopus]|uniref:Uncharacterized protein n=1 Tax=Favolaschia claudopus TaxID=2862362 RepID=A0AAV9Z2V3_9AGAR